MISHSAPQYQYGLRNGLCGCPPLASCPLSLQETSAANRQTATRHSFPHCGPHSFCLLDITNELLQRVQHPSVFDVSLRPALVMFRALTRPFWRDFVHVHDLARTNLAIVRADMRRALHTTAECAPADYPVTARRAAEATQRLAPPRRRANTARVTFKTFVIGMAPQLQWI
jgi:hypothetical protein